MKLTGGPKLIAELKTIHAITLLVLVPAKVLPPKTMSVI